MYKSTTIQEQNKIIIATIYIAIIMLSIAAFTLYKNVIVKSSHNTEVNTMQFVVDSSWVKGGW